MIAMMDGYRVDDLMAVEATRPPRASAKWCPIRHGDLLACLGTFADASGWELTDVCYHLRRAGKDCLISADVRVPDLPPPLDGTTLWLGVTNSNAYQLPVSMFAGVRYTATDAIIPLVEIYLGRHTPKFAKYVERNVHKGARMFRKVARDFGRTIARLQGQPMRPVKEKWALFEAARGRWMPGSRVFRVDRKFLKSGGTVWDFVRCYAEVQTLNPPMVRVGGTHKLLQILL